MSERPNNKPDADTQSQAARQSPKEMFDAGVRALSQVTGRTQRSYMCPQCLEMFPSFDKRADGRQLRPDHIPHEKLGLNLMAQVLTCSSCNHPAGSKWEQPATRRMNRIKALQGQIPMGALLKDGKNVVGADLTFDGSHINITPVPGRKRADNPNHFVNKPDSFKGSADSAFEYVPLDAARAYIRFAFLVGFAMFGYTYALNERCRTILRCLDEDGLDPTAFMKPTDLQSTEPPQSIGFLTAPDQLAGTFVVRFAESTVLAPLNGNDADMLATVIDQGVPDDEVVCEWWDYWPNRPCYDADFGRMLTPGPAGWRSND